MREVLGIQDVVLPFVEIGIDQASSGGVDFESAFESAFEAGTVRSEFRTSGDENAAKVIVLVSTETASFPLDGESGELTRKMILAMKFKPSDVFIMEWNHAHVPAPLEIMQTLLRSTKPVLIFGPQTARALIGHYPKIGEWSAFEGVRFVQTESPAELLLHPDKKRTAWEHMQTFMKGLSFG